MLVFNRSIPNNGLKLQDTSGGHASERSVLITNGLNTICVVRLAGEFDQKFALGKGHPLWGRYKGDVTRNRPPLQQTEYGATVDCQFIPLKIGPARQYGGEKIESSDDFRKEKHGDKMKRLARIRGM